MRREKGSLADWKMRWTRATLINTGMMVGGMINYGTITGNVALVMALS